MEGELRPETSNAVRPTVSAVLEDGTLVELLRRTSEQRTLFAVWRGGDLAYEDTLDIEGLRLVPYSPENNLLRHEVVLLPTEAAEYGTVANLVGEVQTFIHRYVDVSPLFERLASYYVLLSWVYDAFEELPYLRVRGEPGSGKTRFLLTVGSLCYTPIFASGASSVSPLFRILDAFRGTLVIDEGDFRLSDERAEVVKILNNGNARGFPVLRSELTSKREYNPTAFAVFGPKLVATRGYFEDRALESRCLTEEMGGRRLREDVPINLKGDLRGQALELRNKLLLFRFRNRLKCGAEASFVDRTIEPRLSQVFVPLLSVVEDPKTRGELQELARQYNRELVSERGMDTEAQILEIIQDLRAQGQPLSVKDITSWLADRHGEDYERKVTPKWVGWILRSKLHLKTQKSHGAFVIADTERAKLEQLFDRYGLNHEDDRVEAAKTA